MARIRTIKPDFFTSEDIVGLSPLARLLYIATWCEADREGRMVWRPMTLKLRYLPGDSFHVDALVAELVDAGLIKPYVVDGKSYAEIPTFTRHQVINNRESASSIPPRPADACATREARDSDACATPLVHDQGEGKGKEGKEITCAVAPHDDEPEGFANCWSAYPKREGGNSRKEAVKAYRARIKQGATHVDLLAGVGRYAAFIRAKGQEGTAFVKQAATFLGTGEHWREAWAIETAVKSEAEAWSEGLL